MYFLITKVKIFGPIISMFGIFLPTGMSRKGQIATEGTAPVENLNCLVGKITAKVGTPDIQIEYASEALNGLKPLCRLQ